MLGFPAAEEGLRPFPADRSHNVTTHPRTGEVPLRRLAAAILAVPVIASIYISALMAVPGARRYLASLAGVLLVGIVGVGILLPPGVSSTPPSSPRPFPEDQLQPISPGLGADAIHADPKDSGPAVLADANSAPVSGVTQPALGAVAIPDASESAIPSAPAGLAVASVRNPTTVRVAGSQISGNRVRLTTSIVLRFDRAVTLAAVRAALTVMPAVKGAVAALSDKVYAFTPANRLPPNTGYTISFTKPMLDADGAAVTAPKVVHLLTVAPPALVRFRPTKGTSGVDSTAAISVRFTLPMNHSTTQKAFSVVVAGKKIPGAISWAENSTVLVFKPAKALTKGIGVGVRLLATATSADGVPIKKGGSSTFEVVPAPTPQPAARTVTRSSSTITKSGGGSLGGGSWAAAEAYYLKLMNCTRTGGWVTSSGACDSPGGRSIAPLWIDRGISANVSRPYAKYLASTGMCSHFADGNPGARLRRAGYTSETWAENISCPKSMSPMALMLFTQQYFQSERSYNGGHYVNLMSRLYDRVGIGVWVANGRAEIVIDFYHP